MNSYHDFDRVAEPENRIGFVTTSLIFREALKQCYRSGVSSVFLAEDNIAPVHIGYFINVAHKDIITLKASQFVESGIISYWMKKTIYGEPPTKQEEIGPQVLTLQHLSAGFVVIFALLALSIIAFAAECAPKLLRSTKKWIQRCVMGYVVMKFTRMNKML
jgi:hypothetical protein